jgi:hypothetical protein
VPSANAMLNCVGTWHFFDSFSHRFHRLSRGGIRLSAWIWGLLISQFLLAAATYQFLYRRRKLIGFHLGMNIAMVAGGGLALGTGVLLIYEFPVRYMEVTVIAALTGMLVGSMFGGMFDNQTLLTGYISGLMTGMMAPMIGAASSYSLPFAFMMEFFVLCSFMMLLKATKSSRKT